MSLAHSTGGPKRRVGKGPRSLATAEPVGHLADMASIDLKKELSELYSGKPGVMTVVDVPPRPHLMIDGAGDPNTSQAYRDAVATLYPLAYGVRAAIKAETGEAYTVMPLEGLWWVPDMREFTVDDKSAWRWTAMISLPEAATSAMAAAVIPSITAKKGLPSGEYVRLELFGDGLAAQVMYLGPYADEGPTIQRLHDFIANQGGSLHGKHHEIYLSDPRKVDPAKQKTIIRQPMA